MAQVHRYVGVGSGFTETCLRASNLVTRRGDELQILTPGAGRIVSTAWTIDVHELSPDGAYVLARGDQGRRFGVWETATGTLLFEGHDDSRRESVRASLAPIGDHNHAFVATRSRPTALVMRTVPGGLEESWLSTTGMIAFEVQQVQWLGGTWVGVLGHSDGDQFDTVVAVDLQAPESELLQTALRESPSIKDWGFRVAIGPGTNNQAVIFRDAEWDDGDRPDRPRRDQDLARSEGLRVPRPAWNRHLASERDQAGYKGEPREAPRESHSGLIDESGTIGPDSWSHAEFLRPILQSIQ